MNTAAVSPLLLRPREAAATLGIGRSKLYELLAEGRLESMKLGNCRLIPRESLEALVAEERRRQSG